MLDRRVVIRSFDLMRGLKLIVVSRCFNKSLIVKMKLRSSSCFNVSAYKVMSRDLNPRPTVEMISLSYVFFNLLSCEVLVILVASAWIIVKCVLAKREINIKVVTRLYINCVLNLLVNWTFFLDYTELLNRNWLVTCVKVLIVILCVVLV